MDLRDYFAGKKITILGLGLLGRGVGDARYLAQQGAELIVTDLKSAEELSSSLEQLKEFDGIQYTLGEHRVEDFQGRDFILKAAGVPDPSPYLDAAREAGTPIKMSASWFAELSGITCIGITGTRGKSTTTHMVNAVLKEAGIPSILGGNVRGVSTLAFLETATPEHVAVLELDSWQCQGWGEERMSPHIAAFTTFYPDHLNYYKGDLDRYLSDKANIFLFQKPGDTLVLGAQCAGLIQERYAGHLNGWVSIVGADDVADWDLHTPGEHNRYDAACALAIVRALDIDDATTRKAIEAFPGVPGRLELIGEPRGVYVYNDTTATTPEATMAALAALGERYGNRIVLIMGGADKGLDMEELMACLPGQTKHVVLLSGSGTERVAPLVPHEMMHASLADAVEEAFTHAEAGDAILLSPAFASFGLFANEYDRGDQFNEIVTRYDH